MKVFEFRYLAPLVGLLIVVQTLPFWWGSDAAATSAGWLTDDGFFYAVIAEHLVDRGAMEFYPGMETNGFQPLWMAVVATAHGLFSSVTALEWIRYLSVAAYVGFALLTAGLLMRDKAVGGPAAALFAAVVLVNPGIQQWVLNGLETAAALAVFAATMWQVYRVARSDEPPGWTDVVILAVLGALCFLARTDLFVVSVVLAGWTYWRWGMGLRWGVFVGVTAACVLPYLAFNSIKFGALVPLSGQAQQFYVSTYHGGWSNYVSSEQWQGIFYAFFELLPLSSDRFGAVVAIVEAMTITIPVGAGYVAFRDRRYLGEGALAEAVRVFVVIAAVHLAVMYGYHRGVRPFASYYFAPTVVVSCMALALAAARALGRWREGAESEQRRWHRVMAGVGAVGWALVVGAASWGVWTAGVDRFWEQRVELSAELDQMVGDDATVGAYWPGALAYFSTHEVVPIDGVVASAEFQQEVMREKRALEYLCEREEPYLAVYLHRSLEMWRQIDERPEVLEWMWAHKYEMWAYGMDRFEVVTHRSVGAEPGGWYLLQMEGC